MAKSGTDTERIIATVAELERQTGQTCRMVIIDTKAQVVGDDNSSADVPAFVRHVAKIQAACEEVAVVIVDHSAFYSPTKMRGHTSLLGAADTTVLVEKKDGVRTATIQKGNDLADDGRCIAFDMQTVEIGTDEDGEITTAPVLIEADAPTAQGRSDRPLPPSLKLSLIHI